MLTALAEQLGTGPLAPWKVIRDGVKYEVDGADEGRTVLAECWAHQGAAKGAQKQKLLTDALKLRVLADDLGTAPRLVLCVADERAIAHLRGRSWHGKALRTLGVEVAVVTLPAEVAADVAAAQTLQFR